MTDNEIRNRILTEFEISGDKKVERALNNVKLRTIEARAEASFATNVSEKWVRTMRGLERQEALRNIAKELEKSTKNGKDFDKILQSVQTRLDRMGASAAEVNQVVRQASSAGQGRGRNTLQVIGSEVRALPAVPLGGNLSTDVIGKLTSTLGGLGVAGTAAALAIGATIVALKASTAGIEQSVKSIIASQEAYYRALKTGTEENVRAAIATQKIEIEITRSRVQEYQRLFTNLEAQVGTVGRGIADALDLGGARQLREETQKLEQELRDLEFGLSRLEAAADSTEVATRTLEEAEKELAKRRQSIVDQRIQTQLSAEMEAVNSTGMAIQERIKSLNLEQKLIFSIVRSGEASVELSEQLTQRSRDIVTLSEVLSRELPAALARDAQNALEQLGQRAVELEAQHQDQMVQIKTQGDKQIESAEKALSKARANLVEFDAQQADKRTEIETDYRQSELKRTREFNKSLARLKEDGNRRLLELSRQLEQDQFEAELANNTAQFIQAQQRFKLNSQKEKDNLSIEAQRRLEDFNEESQRNQQLLNQKLDALDKESDAKRQKLEAELQEREAAAEQIRNEIQQRLADEKAAYKESLQALVDELDDANRDMTNVIQAGFKVLEAAGIDTFNNIIGNLQRQANAFYSSQARAQMNPYANVTIAANQQQANILGRTVRAFAAGTPSTRSIYGDRAAVAVVNDVPPGWDEAIIPYRRSAGGPAGMGGIVVNVNGPLMVDDKMTRQDFKREMTTIIMEMGEGIAMARGRT